jgi:hypothetical protein
MEAQLERMAATVMQLKREIARLNDDFMFLSFRSMSLPVIGISTEILKCRGKREVHSSPF